jgi:hypothetical protein
MNNDEASSLPAKVRHRSQIPVAVASTAPPPPEPKNHREISFFNPKSFF